ncbi:MAG TPA: LytR C-terminal domain-containing protein [Actinocrinis sp.]|nr:LytR C-terminal domain-containing protein [Actinocrinis sp.]
MDQTPSPAEPPEDGPAAGTAVPPTPPPAPTLMEHLDTTPARPRVGREIGGKKFRVGAGDEYVPFRSRTKRRRKLIAAGAFGVLVLGAGAYGVVTLVGSDPRPAAAGCPARTGTGATSAALARGAAGSAAQLTAGQIKLNVYNSTTRNGLAAATAAELKKRGFAIGKVTNDPLKANLAVAAEVRGAVAPAMRMVAAEVAGAQLHADTRTDGSIDLVLGTGFTALSSPDQVTAALAASSPSTGAKKAAACR